jgi:nucleoside 2-deoxyribosyltransferase
MPTIPQPKEQGGTMTPAKARAKAPVKAKQPARVYLAGPMFSDGDKSEQTKLAIALRRTFKCHVPQDDGIEVAAVMELLNEPSLHDPSNLGTPMLEPIVLARCAAWVTRAVVALDVYEVIEGCQCVVLNIDGRVPDEGALVEASLAWTTGHPVVTYKTTSISELGGNNNPMIGVIGGWTAVTTELKNVVPEVRKALNSAGAVQPASSLPTDVQDLVALGRVIAGIRGKRSLNPAQLAAAAETLKVLPQAVLLEPDPTLQPMSQEVVLAVIEFSKLGRNQKARQQTLFQNQIAALQTWAAKPDIRAALLQSHPLPC